MPSFPKIVPTGKPAAIIGAWLDGKFTLLSCATHLDELRATLQKPRIIELIKPHKAGRLVNQIKTVAEDIDLLPPVEGSPDPADDYLLALAEAGQADYLVTGDKSGFSVLTGTLARGSSPRENSRHYSHEGVPAASLQNSKVPNNAA